VAETLRLNPSFTINGFGGATQTLPTRIEGLHSAGFAEE
jgi:hypothetical protein